MKKNVFSTNRASDFIAWDSACMLINRLYKDCNYTMACFIACGIYFGLRVSDLRKLRWEDLLFADSDTFTIHEQKTGKQRTIKINQSVKRIIADCYKALEQPPLQQHIFVSRKNCVYSTQRLNVILKEIKDKYNVPCRNISCHSLRKTFGRAIFEKACKSGQGEMSLLKLQSVFGHSSPQITKIYLGIKQQEILQCYDLLD